MIEPRCLSHGEVRPPLFQGGFVSHGKWFRGPCVHPDEEGRGCLAELDKWDSEQDREQQQKAGRN
jgi:hypothetical protein